MAHIAKYSRGAVGHMLSHYDRSKDNLSGNIDSSRTPENYNLAVHQPLSQLDFIHQRLSEVKTPTRKDLNVLCDWVVTLPKNIDRAGSCEFMERTYKFMVDRYGEQNVISAYVHMDEVQPHMHFAFVPVVEDQKHGGYKVSAKEAVTRFDLQTFHKDLDAHMERAYGRNIGILNEATREGNRSIEELKRGDAVQQVQEIRQQAVEAAQTLSSATERLQAVVKEQSASEDVLERLRRDTEQAQQGLREVQKSAARMTDTADKYAKQKMATADRDADRTIKDAQRDAADLHGQAEKEARETLSQAKAESEAIRREIPALQEQRDTVTKELAEVRAEAKYTEVHPLREKRGVFDKEVKEVVLSAEDYRKYNAAIQHGYDLERDLRLAQYDIDASKYQKKHIGELEKENKDLRHERNELVTENKWLISEIDKGNAFFNKNPDVLERFNAYTERLELEAEKIREAAEQAVDKVSKRMQDMFQER